MPPIIINSIIWKGDFYSIILLATQIKKIKKKKKKRMKDKVDPLLHSRDLLSKKKKKNLGCVCINYILWYICI